MTRHLFAPLAVLILAACSGGSDEAAQGPGGAPGEVLEGSVSDAMIPYGELRSQPPLEEAPPASGSAAGGGAAPAGASAADAVGASGEAAGEASGETPQVAPPSVPETSD